MFDSAGGDRSVAMKYGVPILAVDLLGYSHAGNKYIDHIDITGVELTGSDFLDMVAIMRK